MVNSAPFTAVDKPVRNSGATSLEGLWRRMLERLAEGVSEDITADDASQIVARLRPLELTSTDLRLEAPNQLVLVCVTDHYLPRLREAVAAYYARGSEQFLKRAKRKRDRFVKNKCVIREKLLYLITS